MYITVEKALESYDCFSRVQLIAGAEGLNKEIKWVNIMEVPQVARWMQGGELLLTAGYAFKEDSKVIETLVSDLVEKGVSCLGIKVGQYINAIPEKIIHDANAYNLPVLQLPSDLSYYEVMLPITENIMNQQLSWMKKEKLVHSKLMKVVASGEGFDGICQTLVEIFSCPTIILNSSLHPLSYKYPGNSSYPFPRLETFSSRDLLSLIPAEPLPSVAYSFSRSFPKQDLSGIIIPLSFQTRIGGYLFLLEGEKPLSRQNIVAAESASLVASLELSKWEAIMNKEIQIKGELVEDLVYGDYHSENVIMHRLQYYGFNPEHPIAVFVFKLGHPQGEKHLEIKEIVLNEIIKTIEAVFAAYPGKILTQSKGMRLIAITESLEEQEISSFLSKVIEEVRHKSKLNICVGYGGTSKSLTEIRLTYEKALEALHLGSNLYPNRSIYFFEDLFLYKILWEVRHTKQLKDFYETIMGALASYEEKETIDLIETLRIYFQNNGNGRKTSEQLFIHRNTLLYRLKKIEEITGLNLKNYQDRFSLQLGIFLTPFFKPTNET